VNRAYLPVLATAAQTEAAFRSSLCGSASPSVSILVLLLFPFDRGRTPTTPSSRRESSRQVTSGTSFQKVERTYSMGQDVLPLSILSVV
jgi:hypothetical protein